MEQLIDQYIQTRNKVSEYTTIQDSLKDKIKAKLKDLPEKSYSKDGKKASLKTQIRSAIQKTNVPAEIWEQYSVSTQYEVLKVENS